jgi:hypothetical protein
VLIGFYHLQFAQISTDFFPKINFSLTDKPLATAFHNTALPISCSLKKLESADDIIRGWRAPQRHRMPLGRFDAREIARS